MAFAIKPNWMSTSWYSSSNNGDKSEVQNLGVTGRRSALPLVFALERSNSSSSDGKKGGVPNSNYVVPLETSFPFSNSLTRPLAEILRDLNKRIPDNIVKAQVHGDGDPSASTVIPWYHANRMLSFYAPGWCGEIRDVIFSDNRSVTVVYRVTVRGSDGEDLATGRTIEVAKEQGGLYYLLNIDVACVSDQKLLPSCHQIGSKSLTFQIWLQHKRLGHPPFPLFKVMFPSLFSKE